MTPSAVLFLPKTALFPEDGATFTIDTDTLHIESSEIAEHRLRSALVTLTIAV